MHISLVSLIKLVPRSDLKLLSDPLIVIKCHGVDEAGSTDLKINFSINCSASQVKKVKMAAHLLGVVLLPVVLRHDIPRTKCVYFDVRIERPRIKAVLS